MSTTTTPAITALTAQSARIWLEGWYMLVVLEIALRWIKGSPWGVPPWSPMIAFTFLFYCGVGLIGGCTASGVISLVLTIMSMWRQRIAAIPLTMASCIATITLLYSGPFIYHQLLQLYPSFSQTLITVMLIISSLVLFSLIYILCARIGTKTRLGIFYSALSFALYTIMIGGFYINQTVLSGKPFTPDSRGVLIAAGILLSSVVLYGIVYSLAPVIRTKAVTIATYIPIRALLVLVIIVLIIVGTLGYIIQHSPFTQPTIPPNSPREDTPNIILITLDTVRADHLSCYGYHKQTTPHLDAFAQESAVFKNAYAPSPWTLPSHASIFTGMYSAGHGADKDWDILHSNWPRKLETHHVTLAEILAEQGYQTAGIIASHVIHSSTGLAQGFARYDEELISVLYELEHFSLYKLIGRWVFLDEIAGRWGICGYRRSHQVNARVFSWLEQHNQSPFFLFIHYFDPHLPYIPPERYYRLFREDETVRGIQSEGNKRELVAKYDGELAYLDHNLGKFFTRLKECNLYDNSMIIITSDHGEFFGEHDMWIHGYEIYEEVLRVPLIIKYPVSFPQHGAYEQRVSLVDIMPTLLHFLGLPLPHGCQGTDLFKERSRVMAEVYRSKYTEIYDLFIDRYVKDERFRKEGRLARQLKALYLDNYKYIKEYPAELQGRDELYDIENDPQELYNVIETMPERAKEMEMLLTEWLKVDEHHGAQPQPAILDKATEEGLRSLGYLQ